MAGRIRLDLTDLDTYRDSCLKIAAERLKGLSSMAEIEAAMDDLNAYPNLNQLSEPRGVYILDEETIGLEDLDRARSAVLEGRVFWEHAAAGEATRLKLGTKYLIDPGRDLTVKDIAARVGEELNTEVAPAEIRRAMAAPLEDLLPLDLGARHMLQLAYDLIGLAKEDGRDPESVLARQKLLLVVNEKTAEAIVSQVQAARFMGFSRKNFFFMIQPAFQGINLAGGRFFFDPSALSRLHNHGQLVMQETMDDQLFRLDETGQKDYLKAQEFAVILEGSLDKISYNIEDLGYLTDSVDWPSLALALKLGGQGYDMVMEIVANNPDRPQKGGLAAFDHVLDRNAMIESFQLKGMPNEEIKFLNKNFNHYTNPLVSWRELKEKGLPMPLSVKGGYLYFQPVQGDINFLVKTAFVKRKRLKPIQAWKSAANTVQAINTMWAQDNQPGFRDLASGIPGRAN